MTCDAAAVAAYLPSEVGVEAAQPVLWTGVVADQYRIASPFGRGQGMLKLFIYLFSFFQMPVRPGRLFTL